MTDHSARRGEERWRGRPILSALLRTFVFAVPIVASILATAALRHALPQGSGSAEHGVRIAILLLASTVVLVVTDRLARRLMPLVVLLKLSLAFPDEAPSRMRLARTAASTRDLESRVAEARRRGFFAEPARAAEHILTLVAAVEAHDRATRGHSERVRVYTDMLAAQMGLPLRDRDRLRWAALLHDVGKLEVPKRILSKSGKLTKSEWEAIYLHPNEGARLTAPLRAWLGRWATAVEQHHERFDGSGYPLGLAGEDISLGGRMVAITDSYECMTASRPYRRALSAAKARAEVVRCSGTDFDPRIVRPFLEISVKRLSLVSGPLSWLAQTPLLRSLEQAAAAGKAFAGAGAGAAILAVAPVTKAPASPRVSPTPSRSVAVQVRSTLPANSQTTFAILSPSPSPSPKTRAEPTITFRSPSPSPSPDEDSSGNVGARRPSPSSSPEPLLPLPRKQTTIQ